MENIDKLIREIIPWPANVKNRMEFSNFHIIDKLSESEKLQVEIGLLEELKYSPNDMLIVETLAYLKSTKSIDFLYKLLSETTDNYEIVTISSSIYRINKDKKLISIALNAVMKIPNERNLIWSFNELAKFNHRKTNKFIKSFFNHKDFIISYNAKRALNQL